MVAEQIGRGLVIIEAKNYLHVLLIDLSADMEKRQPFSKTEDFWAISIGGLILMLALAIFFMASLAACHRAPFDLHESESELIGGYHTEYGGLRWAWLMLAEYSTMLLMSLCLRFGTRLLNRSELAVNRRMWNYLWFPRPLHFVPMALVIMALNDG